jgi:hypothetical protein
MTEEAKRDWLTVAWDSLQHLPPEVLTSGARQARLKCDHPSKIVPTIIAETEQQMRWRRDARAEPLQIAGPEPQYCTPEEASAILAQLGLKSSFSPGSKPLVETPQSGSMAKPREPDQRQ